MAKAVDYASGGSPRPSSHRLPQENAYGELDTDRRAKFDADRAESADERGTGVGERHASAHPAGLPRSEYDHLHRQDIARRQERAHRLRAVIRSRDACED